MTCRRCDGSLALLPPLRLANKSEIRKRMPRDWNSDRRERKRKRKRGGGERERAPFFWSGSRSARLLTERRKSETRFGLRLEAFVERHRISSLDFFPRSFSSCRRSTSTTSGTRASVAAAPLSSSPRSSGPGAAGDGETDGGGREGENEPTRSVVDLDRSVVDLDSSDLDLDLRPQLSRLPSLAHQP